MNILLIQSKATVFDSIKNLYNRSGARQIERIEDNVDLLDDTYEIVKDSVNTTKLSEDDFNWYTWNDTSTVDPYSPSAPINTTTEKYMGTELPDIVDYDIGSESEDFAFNPPNSEAKVANKLTDDLNSNMMSARGLDEHHSLDTSITSIKDDSRTERTITDNHLSNHESLKMNHTIKPNNGSSDPPSSSVPYMPTYWSQLWLFCVSIYSLLIL